jgi:hypothetical protein
MIHKPRAATLLNGEISGEDEECRFGLNTTVGRFYRPPH